MILMQNTRQVYIGRTRIFVYLEQLNKKLPWLTDALLCSPNRVHCMKWKSILKAKQLGETRRNKQTKSHESAVCKNNLTLKMSFCRTSSKVNCKETSTTFFVFFSKLSTVSRLMSTFPSSPSFPGGLTAEARRTNESFFPSSVFRIWRIVKDSSCAKQMHIFLMQAWRYNIYTNIEGILNHQHLPTKVKSKMSGNLCANETVFWRTVKRRKLTNSNEV